MITFSYKSHRYGPAPIHWNSPKGICKWCGCCIQTEKGKPRYIGWHPECVKEFQSLFWPNETRKLLMKSRGRKCEICGIELSLHRKLRKGPDGKKIPDPNWPKASKNRFMMRPVAEHHHIIPLVDYQHTAEDPWAAWRPENLILLCHDCHLQEHRNLRKLGMGIGGNHK